MAGVIGLMIATVGTDPISGVGRFTYGSPELLSGIPFILVMVGVFAVSERLVQASEPEWAKTGNTQTRMTLTSFKMHQKQRQPTLLVSTTSIFDASQPGTGGTIHHLHHQQDAGALTNTPRAFEQCHP